MCLGRISRDSDLIGVESDLGIMICRSSQGDFYAAMYGKHCITESIGKWMGGMVAKGQVITPPTRQLRAQVL